MDWKSIVKNAEHYKAIGQTEIFLHIDGDDRPWEFVTEIEPGGSQRLEIETTVRFHARHPCGLTFRWCFDVEGPDANYSGSYHIKVDEIRKVMAKLPVVVREQFSAYLESCAVAVEKKAREWEKVTNNQFATARALRQSREWS